ncbi:Hsp70 family protein [Mycobacterium deserti]|uniref:Hsp70 family protein n=1 Tax=Mycobacterium deserti TaxID=2978347 RepID=A0ABT2MDF9_9MYCO|nr:Hsp70 family protein [Mycobacterium deserti]MCT7660304.1 Hsp70 family protein [Mycobacterium deserti]
MSDGVGLSVGATRLAAVVVGRTAVTRSPVLTRFAHRAPEVGVPSENPNLTERGLIITDFVDRVGDPVDIVAADGSSHRADGVLADALRALLITLGSGRPPTDPVAVTYPAHWRPAAVDALRNALSAIPEFQRPKAAPVLSDVAAAVKALQDDPGLPTRGVIAVCDFGGTGTSITLVDAANGYAPVAPTVRHTDFSGDLVDQALLTHVIDDLSSAGTIDLTGTSAIGSLSRLRAQCRGAKERLSTSGVTSLVAELPGHRSELRLTRNELDEVIRRPLDEFIVVLQETLDRSGIRGGALAAVATVGGGARIPIVTTALSETFKVPVVTTAQPELSAAIGGGLAAARGTAEDGMTAMAAAPGVAAAAGAATMMAPEVGLAADEMAPQSSTFGALAWSDADDVPDVSPTDPYDYSAPADAGADVVRPQMQFEREPHDPPAAPIPWYRRPAVAMGTGLVVLVAALGAAALYVMRDDTAPTPASTTAPVSTTTAAPPATSAAPPPPAPPPATQAPPPRTRTVYQAPPRQTATAPPPTQEPPPPPPPESPSPPPPTSEPPPPPPPTTQPPLIPTLPYETIPGLPFVPAPIQPPPAP